MAFDKNSNWFTFLFAAIMVVVVGVSLAALAISLKPLQDRNLELEKMKNIMMSINVMSKSDDMYDAEELYEQLITDGAVLASNGSVKYSGRDTTFAVDVQKEFKSLGYDERNYPILVANHEGNTYYVIPMVGKGLWGPIWGYVSLKDDFTTVYGATFDHKTETPGLGAEISEEGFQVQFKEKTLNMAATASGASSSLLFEVLKGGSGVTKDYAVDGITGGTVTSKGVQEMIDRSVRVYLPYFETKKSQATL